MSLTLTASAWNHSFGATVSGASVQDVLSNEHLAAALVDAFNQHGLLLWRDQAVSPAEELALAKLLPHDADASVEARAGPYSKAFLRWKLPHLPEIQVQGWGAVHDHHGVSGTMAPSVTTREWHTDGIHELERPPVLTTMYSISVPPEGGETLFASGYDAWDALTEAERRRLGHAVVRYKTRPNRISVDGTLAKIIEPDSSTRSNVMNGPDDKADEDEAADTPVAHPLFRRHPTTRRVALYAAPLFMQSVEVDGERLPNEEAAQLVSRLMLPAVQRAYSHTFAARDLVLWDNRCMLHSATPHDEAWGGKPPYVRQNSNMDLDSPYP